MNIYFSFKQYQENYEKELSDFIDDYEDNTKDDFWKEQLKLYSVCKENVHIFEIEGTAQYKTIAEFQGTNVIDEVLDKISDGKEYNFEYAQKLERSFNKILDFITKQISPETQIEASINEGLNWEGTKLELTELIKALIHAQKLDQNLSETKIFKRFCKFLNVEDFNHTDKARDIRDRTKNLTPLIHKLEIALTNWIHKED